jgi:uncharacterized membrane protein affecting hemolysin expression
VRDTATLLGTAITALPPDIEAAELHLLAERLTRDSRVLGVGVYDLNGGGVTLADLGAWAKDYFGAASPDRADYDGNGLVSLSDLGAFTECFFDHRSVASPATLCP